MKKSVRKFGAYWLVLQCWGKGWRSRENYRSITNFVSVLRFVKKARSVEWLADIFIWLTSSYKLHIHILEKALSSRLVELGSG